MTTIEEVVKVWDETHPNNQTETLKRNNVQLDRKIDSWSMYGRLDKWAVIKLANAYPFAKWNERICYVFDFKSGKPEITFQRRSGYPCDTEKLYKLLDSFTNEKIKGKKLTLVKGRINPNNLTLSIRLDINSSAEEICDCMEKFIELTQEKIYTFLKVKDNEKLSTRSNEILSEIINKHGIKEDTDLCGKCEKIYSQTIEISNALAENTDKLEVSHYTKKNTAQKLLIAPRDEKKCDEFRLYSTYGMNDPSEGKTLLSFLEIENEDCELPETLPFIACFSLEVNNLNQFRLYGNENNMEATGVSIVFKPSFFNKVRELYRCVYIDPDNGKISISFSKKEEDEEKEKKKKSEEEKKKEKEKKKEDEEKKKEEEKWIENKQNEVKGLFEELKEKIKMLLEEEIQDKHELAKDLLVNIRYLVKDDAFMEERECRIIDWKNEKDESINIDGDRLYIEIGEVKDYIREIYFAPCAEGIEVFKIKTGIKCIRSRRPYKNPRGNNLTKEHL